MSEEATHGPLNSSPTGHSAVHWTQAVELSVDVKLTPSVHPSHDVEPGTAA